MTPWVVWANTEFATVGGYFLSFWVICRAQVASHCHHKRSMGAFRLN